MSNAVVTREQQAKGLLRSQMSVIQTLTGKDERKSSVFASSILAQATNRNLANCSVESIVKNGVEIVRLGLDPNPTFGQAYIVPFKLKSGGETAQLQIGYKGFINLAYRNGWVFRAVCVYTFDKFKIEFAGINDKIIYEPNFEARQDDNSKWVHENLIGVIVYAVDNQKTEFSEFVPFSKLEKLRLKSQNQNDKNTLKYIWAEWSEEMYKAKALKYVATRLPITEQIQNAINSENAIYSENANLTQKNAPRTQNDSEAIENIDLNQIAFNQPQPQEAEIINNEVVYEPYYDDIPNLPPQPEPKPQQTYKAEPKEQAKSQPTQPNHETKEILKQLLMQKGLNEYEVIDFMAKNAYTPVLAKQFLDDDKKLEIKLAEFFGSEINL